jgi:hypothetical protein
MKRVGFGSFYLLGSLCFAASAAAQGAPPAPPPPAPAPGAQPPPQPQPWQGQPQPSQPQPGQPQPQAQPGQPQPGQPQPAAPPPGPGAGAGAQGGFSVSAGAQAGASADGLGDEELAGEGDPAVPSDYERAWRKQSLNVQNSLSGSTGLLHVSEAFLCSSANPCPSFGGQSPTTEDSVDGVGAHLGLSATITPFLEGYVGFHNRATSNDRGRPQLLQVLGDTNLGIKAFMPREPDSIFQLGGEAQLWLLNGTGGVGIDGGSTSFALNALGTLDLDNRLAPSDRIPLRFHANVGYYLDNSAKIVDEIESNPPPNGRGTNITRIERFGLGINRVDSFKLGFAAEYVHEMIRPFVEWTIDIPLNRQDYTCNLNDAEAAGEGCLGRDQGFSTSPSRFTLGARLFPWEEHGLAFLAGLDIGTGATSDFIDELAPEPPWNLYFGIAYAVDTVPRRLPRPPSKRPTCSASWSKRARARRFPAPSSATTAAT